MPEARTTTPFDTLSAVLRAIRISGSLQFCFMPAGDWMTGSAPSLRQLAGASDGIAPFHIVASGACWLKLGERRVELQAGDVVAFPFGASHQLGAGDGGPLLDPVTDLPPRPWGRVPMLTYGKGPKRVSLLCGYLTIGAASFAPLRHALPEMLLVRTRGRTELAWLNQVLDQIAREALAPSPGGMMTLERLTEVAFVELLRLSIQSATPGAAGWLAAMADPALSRCLAAFHAEPGLDWSAPRLARAAGLSRSALSDRFRAILGASPMGYVREWRLCLAQSALGTTNRAIAEIAYDAGYGSEAAFCRAFGRAFGSPPATWRAARDG